MQLEEQRLEGLHSFWSLVYSISSICTLVCLSKWDISATKTNNCLYKMYAHSYSVCPPYFSNSLWCIPRCAPAAEIWEGISLRDQCLLCAYVCSMGLTWCMTSPIQFRVHRCLWEVWLVSVRWQDGGCACVSSGCSISNVMCAVFTGDHRVCVIVVTPCFIITAVWGLAELLQDRSTHCFTGDQNQTVSRMINNRLVKHLIFL